MDDILDIKEEDSEMKSDEGNESHFKESYHLQVFKSVGLNETYILNMDASANNQIIAGLSNNNVFVYNERLERLCENKLPNSIIDVKFSPQNPELYYIGTPNCIQLWDLRMKNEEGVYEINCHGGQHAPKPFTTFDVNLSDQFLVAGTEVVNHDSYLLFWDIRGKSMLGGYWETFGEDLSVTKFSPKNSNQLISASTDGQINLFDISQENEDDALITALNVEAPAKSITWLKDDKVGILLDHEEIALWKIEDSQPYKIFDRENLTGAIRRKITSWTYVSGIHFDAESEKTFILAGSSCSSNPCGRLLNLSKTKLKPVADLSSNKVKNTTIRASCLTKEGTLVTGSEEGYLCAWNQNNTNSTTDDVVVGENFKSTKMITNGKTSKKPYSR